VGQGRVMNFLTVCFSFFLLLLILSAGLDILSPLNHFVIYNVILNFGKKNVWSPPIDEG
jgi:hypothetical protein